jgi:glycosyltransferase involved in cell wall biosynthesis
VGLAVVPRPDVIVATSPPLTVAITMWLLAMGHWAPAVFEVRDLWPETAITTGVLRSRLLIRLGYRLEALAYRRAAWVNILTPAFEEVLVRDKGVPRRRISMIPNGADLDIMRLGPKDNEVRRRLGLEGKFVVSYFGAHGRVNALPWVLKAAALLRGDPRIRFVLIGDGALKPGLVEQARREGLDNVLFLDPVPKERLAAILKACDLGLMTLDNLPVFDTACPNKFMDYLAAGLRVACSRRSRACRISGSTSMARFSSR